MSEAPAESGNGWTGGQYSLYRALLGAYLVVHFAVLMPWGAELFSDQGLLPEAGASPLLHLFPNVLALVDAPLAVGALIALGALAGLALALGWRDRIAGLVAWYVLACLFGRNPLIANPALPFVGWLLLMHCVVPGAPYGSLAARGRVDPRGGWRLPGPLFAAAWIVTSAAYAYSGWTKLESASWLDGSALARVLENPLARPTALRELLLGAPPIFLSLATWGGLALELSYPLFAVFRRTRPWVWLAMVLLHLGLLATIDFADLTLGMLLVHALTFDPAWLPARGAVGATTIYYDGECGLCHGFVRFVLAEDRAGRFRFGPLQSEGFQRAVPAEQRASLPDSVVVRTADGRLLVRSAGVRHVMAGLGGAWRALAVLAALVPRPLLDFAYERIAAVRKKVFAKPESACPMLPRDLGARFDA